MKVMKVSALLRGADAFGHQTGGGDGETFLFGVFGTSLLEGTRFLIVSESGQIGRRWSLMRYI